MQTSKLRNRISSVSFNVAPWGIILLNSSILFSNSFISLGCPSMLSTCWKLGHFSPHSITSYGLHSYCSHRRSLRNCQLSVCAHFQQVSFKKSPLIISKSISTIPPVFATFVSSLLFPSCVLEAICFLLKH